MRTPKSLLLVCLLPWLAGCPTTDPVAGPGSGSDGSNTDDDELRGTPRDDAGLDIAEDSDGADGGSDGDALVDGVPPVARAADRVEGRVAEPVAFDGSASSDEDGTIVTYAWDFGDGATGDGATASHVYVAVGAYQATLTVTDDDGLMARAVVAVAIDDSDNTPPVALIEFPPAPLLAGTPLTFSGAGSTDEDGSVVEYAWSFETTSPPYELVEGRGESLTQTFTRTGEYEVRLEVTDDQGATAVDVDTMRVVAAPVARITATPEEMEVGETVELDAALSSDPDGTIVSTVWDLGDGSDPEETIAVIHTYERAGSYTVTCTVTDDDGLSDTETITLAVGRVNRPPIARAGPDRSVPIGVEVPFDATASGDPDGTVIAYRWDFEEGVSVFEAETTHVFELPGTHEVRLTVGDDGGLTASDTVLITVGDGNSPPTAVIDVLTAAPSAGAPVAFSAERSSDPDGDELDAYEWDFGDGSATVRGPTRSYTYAAEGTYTVTLRVRDVNGAIGRVTQDVVVAPEGTVPVDVSGRWRLEPLGTGETYLVDCDVPLEIGPATCQLTQTGSNLRQTCGDFVYTGTRTGDNFTLTLTDGWIAGSFLDCGDMYISETIQGTFTSPTTWQGTTRNLTIEYDDFIFCSTCRIEDYSITGRKL